MYNYEFLTQSTKEYMLKTSKLFSMSILAISLIGFGFTFSACKKSDTDPLANFTVSNSTPVIDELVTFTNTSLNAHHVRWTFPDGTTATSNTVSYSFYPNGIYTVRLEAFNKNETISDIVEQDLSVCIGGKVVFYADSNTFKSPIDITFNNEFAGTLTTYTNGIANCGQPGALTIEICPGTYTYTAKDANNKTWTNSVKITANNCVSVKLN